MAAISCGANEITLDSFNGRTIGEIRQERQQELNIPADAKALVNGQEKDNSYVVRPEDEVEFVKPSGTKG